MRLATMALTLALWAGPVPAEELPQKVDAWVLETASRGQTEFLVLLREQADLRGARTLPTKAEKAAFVLDALRSTALRAQAPLLELLAARGAEHRSFWVANMVWVRAGRGLVEELAARDDVLHIYANPTVHLDEPVERQPSQTPASPDGIEWNITKVHAPDVWNLGYTGQGIVVAGGDTGYQWDHPAIKPKYRGWNGSAANHNYNWHDAIHSFGGSCGHDTTAPCDDFGHGTHTMGTMVGDDGGANRIGMAPGARWIGCRNMDQGNGTPARYSECFQWFIAPTDLAGNNADPSKAPHVINNSWSCPASEGCTDPNVLKTIVENTRAAGIEVVVSAGNSGPNCSTVSDPAAIYDASFSVGATDNFDVIAGFSSRGPVTVDGSNRLKPDVSAPGVNVRSCVPPNSYGSSSGTSMAGPHVAGLVALLLSADPGIAGDPDSIEPVITASAVPRTTGQSCGGVPGSQIPNNTYGYGRADALAAFNSVKADLAITQTDSPDPAIPGIPVTFTLSISNAGPASANAVSITDTISAIGGIDSATPTQGSCGVLAQVITCDLGAISSGGGATVSVVVTPSSTGTLTSAASASAGQPDPNAANNSSSAQTAVADCPFPAPSITAPVSVPAETEGLSANVSSGPGHTDTWTLTGGAITAGQGTSSITFTSGAAGSTMLLEALDSLAGCDVPAPSRLISVDFLDVPPPHIFHDDINTVARNGITTGCGFGNYCPGSPLTRGQAAVLLLRAKLGASHAPPDCTGMVFDDVPCAGGFFDPWIEELAALGITTGCNADPPLYCPSNPVKRSQAAVLLLRTKLGSDHTPPDCTGNVFDDVPCTGGFFDPWIEDIASRGITTGCNASPPLFCPDNPNTRGQGAVFLTRTFGLQ